MQLSRIPGLRRVAQVAGPRHQDAILFDSWRGQYGDSPRAISEELHRRGAQVEQIWVADRANRSLVPEGVTVVEAGSAEHLWHLGAARRLVVNNSMPGWFRKRSGSKYLQTWHGTPLKRIAFDIESPSFANASKYLRNLQADVANWDLLVSPNHFSTEIFRQAFRYDGRIVETGYPRNDLLVSDKGRAVRESVRRELGLEEGQRAVLYAPTFRDGSKFSLELDLPRIADALGEETVLLLRAHKLDAVSVGFREVPRVRDVSHFSDVRDLLLAADVLITDYSSVMFDFAVTRKPMLFFTYDLARYRDRLRGFYLDFESEAPGPLLYTTDEVIEALRNLEPAVAGHEGPYRRFVERFCHLEDGAAAKRVTDLLLTL